MKIHQIFINDTNKLPNDLPKFHNICYQQIKKLYPNEEYHLYSGEELEEIIKNNFDHDVYISYKKLKPYANKADLARYCLLYLYGGIYIDLNLYFINTISDLDKLNFFSFRDKPKASKQCWAVHNGIMYSLPKSKVVESAINLIIKNCKNEYYGIDAIDVSGTTVLGQAITLSLPHFGIATNGQLDFFTIKSFDKKMQDEIKKIGYFNKILEGFIMDHNKLIAIKKPTIPGDISSLGFKRTNSYIEMWKDRGVYDSSIKFANNTLNYS
jgi:hypothetical protein